MSVFLYCFREREDILQIFEMFSGQRMMTSYFRIGGLALEPPRGWSFEQVKSFVDLFPSTYRRIRKPAHQQSDHLDAHEGRGSSRMEDVLRPGRYRSHAARRRAGYGSAPRCCPIRATKSSI